MTTIQAEARLSFANEAALQALIEGLRCRLLALQKEADQGREGNARIELLVHRGRLFDAVEHRPHKIVLDGKGRGERHSR